jgi:hypothetical protein
MPTDEQEEVAMNKLALFRFGSLSVFAVSMVGCADMPKSETFRYALPKAVTQVTITQTLGCTSDPSKAPEILSSVSVVPVTTYTADNEHGIVSVKFEDFDQNLSAPDVDVSLTNDGRLKSINTTMTGEGTTITQAAITLATLAAAAAEYTQSYPAPPPPPSVETVCKKIAAISKVAKNADSDSKAPANVITLTYTVTLDYALSTDNVLSLSVDPTQQTQNQDADDADKRTCATAVTGPVPKSIPIPSNEVVLPASSTSTPPTPATPLATTSEIGIPIPPDQNTRAVLNQYGDIKTAAGTFCIAVIGGTEKPTSAQWTGDDPKDAPGGYMTLKLARIASVVLAVHGPSGRIGNLGELWRAPVNVPIVNAPYNILIPNGTTFGTQKFGLQLADDGSITEIHYATSGGASDVGSALQSINQALPTDETKANELAEKSDLIYQQQRLMTCQLTPAKCVSK